MQRTTHLELTTSEVKDRCKDYNERIKVIMHDDNHQIAGDDEDERQLRDWEDYTDLQDDSAFGEEMSNVASDCQIPDADDTFTDVFEDTYLNKEIALARGTGDDNDGVQFGRVAKRLRDADGRPIGKAHENPLLDTREYEVEFLDGHLEALSANLVAQNLFSQIDDEGARDVLLDDIIDQAKCEKKMRSSQCPTALDGGNKRLKGGSYCVNGGTEVPLGSRLRT